MHRFTRFNIKMLLIIGIVAIVAGYALATGLPYTFRNGEVADADHINANFNALLNQAIPVGAVLPWHKSLFYSPATLPSNWVECNGQTLDDADSPLDGRQIPDLNGATDEHGGKGLFVRGGTASGTYQEDQMQSHKHNDSGHTHVYKTRNFYGGGGGQSGSNYYGDYNHNINTGYANLTDPVESSGGVVRHGNETRPANMSMVWIMRIK